MWMMTRDNVDLLGEVLSRLLFNTIQANVKCCSARLLGACTHFRPQSIAHVATWERELIDQAQARYLQNSHSHTKIPADIEKVHGKTPTRSLNPLSRPIKEELITAFKWCCCGAGAPHPSDVSSA